MASTTADKYLQDFQNTIKTNSAALKNIKAGYDTMYQNYANGLVNDGTFQAIENARTNANALTNRNYDNSAKNYYTMYRQNQLAMPEKLSNLGVTGGASETALLKLMNQYSGNMYNNENARNNTINTTNMQYDQQIADNSKNIAQQLADTYLKLAQQAREELLAEQQAALAAARSYGGSGGGYYSGGDGYYYDDYGNSYTSDQMAQVIAKGVGTTVDVAKQALSKIKFQSKPTAVAKQGYSASSKYATYKPPTVTRGTSVANGKRTATGGGATTQKYKNFTAPTKKTTRATGGGTSKARTYNVKSYR